MRDSSLLKSSNPLRFRLEKSTSPENLRIPFLKVVLNKEILLSLRFSTDVFPRNSIGVLFFLFSKERSMFLKIVVASGSI